MKSLIIFVVCAVVANVQADILQDMIGQSLTECKEQVHSKPEDLVQLMQHNPTASTEAKCLLSCLAKKFKLMTATGEIDTKATKDSLKFATLMGQESYGKIIGVFDVCLGQVHVGDNDCEVAYSFYLCGITEAAKVNLPKLF